MYSKVFLTRIKISDFGKWRNLSDKNVQYPEFKMSLKMMRVQRPASLYNISRVPGQNGVSRAWYIVEIHHSGWKPSICSSVSCPCFYFQETWESGSQILHVYFLSMFSSDQRKMWYAAGTRLSDEFYVHIISPDYHSGEQRTLMISKTD